MAYPHETHGEVFIRNFDEGIMRTLGATLDTVNNKWVKVIPGISDPTNIDCVFVTPEQVLSDYIYPSFVVRRQDLRVATERMLCPTLDYKEQFEEDGKFYNESKLAALPFDITYLVQAIARYERHMLLMQKEILRRFHRWKEIIVFDTLGVKRSYDMAVEPVSNVSNLTDLSLKSSGLSLNVMVFAEIDLSDPYVAKTVDKSPIIRTQSKIS